ncbi:hypothetical protein AB4Z50_36275 [Paenibacillus sp. 2TAB26]|uniref:hypothetical protein n=1 Tax=Paenibacillus sp. 2TAB26 TaxID=3233005 RepID=UPI003F9D1730
MTGARTYWMATGIPNWHRLNSAKLRAACGIKRGFRIRIGLWSALPIDGILRAVAQADSMKTRG